MEIIKFEGVYSSMHWSTVLFTDINCKGEMWYLERLLQYGQWTYIEWETEHGADFSTCI